MTYRILGIFLMMAWSLGCGAQTEGFFKPVAVPDSIAERVIGCSLPRDAEGVTLAELRYIPLLHCNAEGQVCRGEIIVNEAIAGDVAAIFHELYKQRYPIERIRLIDYYGANDERSMAANNSSGFCYRRVSGSKKLSRHSLGMAIDINPLYNPCVTFARDAQGNATKQIKKVEPAAARKYADRRSTYPYKLTSNDLAVRLFKKYGFRWGGDWRTKKDWQHFEK